MFARDVMDTSFHCLKPDQTILEAVQFLREASEAEGKKIFGMMVTDDQDRLVGMLSMFDILLFVKPKHIEIFGEMDDISLEVLFAGSLEQVKKIRVEDIMTTELVTINADTHLIVIVDTMIRKHVRRLPVVDAGSVVGIVYRSQIFDTVMAQFV